MNETHTFLVSAVGQPSKIKAATPRDAAIQWAANNNIDNGIDVIIRRTDNDSVTRWTVYRDYIPAYMATMLHTMAQLNSQNLDELAQAQKVEPMEDVTKLFGTSPIDDDDTYNHIPVTPKFSIQATYKLIGKLKSRLFPRDRSDDL